MRFIKIELQNYRQYKEIEFNFEKKLPNDLHIILGKNGIGKTNLLNAITWCLYDHEYHLGESSKRLPKINLEAKKNAVTNNLSQLTISVKIYAEDNGNMLIFQREQLINIENDFENKSDFKVIYYPMYGDVKTYENEKANSYVQKYMPEKINQYFFFDGEQLHNYFNSIQNIKIKESINTISQVELLTRIKDRLDKIITNKRKEAEKNLPDISNINDEIEKLKNAIAMIENNILELEDQINKSKNIIKTNTEYLIGQENLPELEEKYQKLYVELKNLKEEKNEISKDLLDFIKKYTIYLNFFPIAKSILNLINEKEEKKLLPPNIDKNYLLKMLNIHKCLICNRDLGLEEEKFINEIINTISFSNLTSHLLLEIKNELNTLVNNVKVYQNKKIKLLKSKKQNEDKIKDIEIELQNIDNQINRFSDKEKVKLLYNERKDHNELLEKNLQKLGTLKNNLFTLQKKKDSLEEEVSKLMKKHKEIEKLNNKIEILKKSKDIVKNIEEEMIKEVKDKMQETTEKNLLKLLWKKNTYSKIILDDNYGLDLIHVEGYSCIGTCSAAERALLALSFTLALHEVSGFESLLFIDTPVARISDQNRINFANVLKEISKTKQIIIAFSLDEYSDEIKNIFKDSFASLVELKTLSEKVTFI